MEIDKCGENKAWQKTRVLSIMSIISFIGYFFITISISNMSRWYDLSMWIVNVISRGVSESMLPMVGSLILVRVVGSGLFCVIMIYFSVRLKRENTVSIIPYFLPIIDVMSHAIGWAGLGSVSIGWLLSLPISLLAISTVFTLLKEKGIEKLKKSTKVFVGAVVISFAIWLYMFSFDMRLMSRHESPRFAFFTSGPSYMGIGWLVQYPMSFVVHLEDLERYWISFWPILMLVLVFGLYLLFLFVIIKIIEWFFNFSGK